jgi:tRNA threonylcarbamoyladenosine biosynthesis protein TsaE
MSGPLLGPGRPVGRRVPLSTEQRAALSGPVLTVPSAGDMRALGVRLAGVTRAGDLILLTGPLGAGKTVLAQGIGAGLGVRGAVVSPTFVIARVHRPAQAGGLPLVHVDAYRLNSLEEVDDLDLDVDAADAVTVVEWGAGLVEQLSEARLEVAIARAPDSEERTVRLMPFGGDWPARVSGLAP